MAPVKLFRVAAPAAAGGASAPTDAALVKAGKAVASETAGRPPTYRATLALSALTARCDHCAAWIGWPGLLRWPFTCTKGTPWSTPINNSLAPSRRAYSTCCGPRLSGRTQAEKVNGAPAASASEGEAGSINGAVPRRAPAPMTEPSSAGTAVWAWLP